VRVFSSRNSTGVRGIRLAKGDEVIGMSVIRHVKVEIEQRDAYLQAVGAARRLKGGDYTERVEDKARDTELAARLEQPEFQEMAANEEFILTIAEDGMGKRTSAYEYRIAGRGGQGITGIDLSRGKKQPPSTIVSAFTVIDGDQIIMVSDGGQIIRCPIDTISIVGRSARGVTVFKVAEDESLVSISRLRDLGDEDEDEDEDGGIGNDVEAIEDVADDPEGVLAEDEVQIEEQGDDT